MRRRHDAKGTGARASGARERPVHSDAIADLEVLVVCTANQCRSPMAAALLAHHLAAAGIPARVTSAGVRADGTSPATANAVRVMRSYGLDVADHCSRRLTRDGVRAAGLVVGMTREHVREAVVLEPDAFERSFTVKELARRAEGTPRGAATVEQWLHALGSTRPHTDLLGDSPEDDVEDPIGGPMREYEATAAELDDAIRRIATAARPRA